MEDALQRLEHLTFHEVRVTPIAVSVKLQGGGSDHAAQR